jgi:hypothetical protein
MMYICIQSFIVDIYAVGGEDNTWVSLKEKEVPFMHWLWIHGPQGELVRVNALFDGGAMVGRCVCQTLRKLSISSTVKPAPQASFYKWVMV